jgi:hypothetical protein
MGSEATIPRIGELRMADVRAVFGESLAHMTTIDVLVIDADATTALTARVELGELPAGPGRHLALRCPSCGDLKHSLFARRGSLGCRSCHRHVVDDTERIVRRVMEVDVLAERRLLSGKINLKVDIERRDSWAEEP